MPGAKTSKEAPYLPYSQNIFRNPLVPNCVTLNLFQGLNFSRFCIKSGTTDPLFVSN